MSLLAKLRGRINRRSLLIAFGLPVLTMISFGAGALYRWSQSASEPFIDARSTPLPSRVSTGDLRADWLLAAGSISETDAIELARESGSRTAVPRTRILFAGISRTGNERGSLDTLLLIGVDAETWSIETIESAGAESMYRLQGVRGVASEIENSIGARLDAVASLSASDAGRFAGSAARRLADAAMPDESARFEELHRELSSIKPSPRWGPFLGDAGRIAISVRDRYPGLYRVLLTEFLEHADADLRWQQADVLFACHAGGADGSGTGALGARSDESVRK